MKVLIEKERDEFVVYKTSTYDGVTEKVKIGSNSDADYAGMAALELAESLGIGSDRVNLGAGVPENILEGGDQLRRTLGKLKRS